ncbi:GNAT family N-acetyltransferase [candidate division TA06 bacterium]|nr:GNAT family N-acetyltransferase [candidate division TA06 bacterium]
MNMPNPAGSLVKKYLLIAAGLVSLGLGVIGIFLPLLPTTPFLLLSAFCFLRSSQRLHGWLVNHRVFGAFIHDYLKYRAVPLKTKILALVLLWGTISLSIILLPNLTVRIFLAAVALGISLHILSLKTRRPGEEGGLAGLAFREIEPRDIPELLVLRTMVKENRLSAEDLVKIGITEESVTAKLNSTYRGWLCRDQSGRALGFSIGNKSDGEMWVIAILPEFEGRGIGRKLMLLVQDWLFQFHDELWLTTEHDPGNRAYGFYQSLGWRETGVVKDLSRFVLKKPAP